MSGMPTLTERFAALSAELRLLVSGTAAIARAEARQSTAEGAAAVAVLVGGALLAILAAFALAAAAILAIVALGAPPWAAALGVAVLLGIAGGGAGWLGLQRLRRVTVTFPETRGSIEESLEWLKELRR